MVLIAEEVNFFALVLQHIPLATNLLPSCQLAGTYVCRPYANVWAYTSTCVESVFSLWLMVNYSLENLL